MVSFARALTTVMVSLATAGCGAGGGSAARSLNSVIDISSPFTLTITLQTLACAFLSQKSRMDLAEVCAFCI